MSHRPTPSPRPVPTGAPVAPVGTASGHGEPHPVRFSRTVRYPKEEAFEICAALALAEVVLRGLGRPVEAARLARVFDLAERRLAS